MPDELWASVHDTLGTGQGLPALYNDERITRSLVSAGYPVEDARDFCLAGCSQIIIPGKSHLINDTGMMNAAKILEVAFQNGVDPAGGRRIGPATGEATELPDFESVLRAFERQIDHFCELEKRINDKDVAHRAAREGYALRSLLTQGCIETGRGIYEGGAVYNGLQLEVIGLTNAADSLEAVRTAVFDEGVVSLPELVAALEADFAGNERLRQFLLRRAGKFGNGHEGVDALRRRITAFTFDALRRLPGPLGGCYIPGEVIFIAHEPNGRAVGATPDGRRAGTVLADSAGPMQGRDSHGPTAMLRSVAALPVGSPYTCIVTNLRFTPDLFRRSREPIAALLAGFFQEGGIQVQVSVADSGALADAMEHPERHEGLIVRVGGYSAYFVGLSQDLQREILERTTHTV
jgi:formate C-acetyltransferase